MPRACAKPAEVPGFSPMGDKALTPGSLPSGEKHLTLVKGFHALLRVPHEAVGVLHDGRQPSIPAPQHILQMRQEGCNEDLGPAEPLLPFFPLGPGLTCSRFRARRVLPVYTKSRWSLSVWTKPSGTVISSTSTFSGS